MNPRDQIFPPRTVDEEAAHRLGLAWRLILLVLLIVASIYSHAAYSQTAWTQCAVEGGTCVLPAQKSMHYGQSFTNRWTAPRVVVGSIPCTNAYWTDPSPGIGKRCQIQDAPPPPSGILTPLTSGEVYVITWTPPQTGSVLKTLTQASSSPNFETYYQWESPGLADPSLYVENGPTGTLYWRIRVTTASGTSDFPAVVVTERQWVAQQKPPCWPKPYGTGTWMKANQNTEGFSVYWQCTLNGVSDHYGFIGAWASLDPDWTVQLATAIETNSLGALWDAKIGQSQDPKYANIRPMWNALRDANPLPVVPPPSPWKVAVNGTSTSRPAYAIVNGLRTTTVVGRVAVGATCDCAAFTSGTHCAVTGQDNMATAIIDVLGPSAAICSTK